MWESIPNFPCCMQFFYPTVGLAHILRIGRQSGIHSLFFPHLLVREILYRSWCFFFLEQPYIGNKVFNVPNVANVAGWLTFVKVMKIMRMKPSKLTSVAIGEKRITTPFTYGMLCFWETISIWWGMGRNCRNTVGDRDGNPMICSFYARIWQFWEEQPAV